MRLRVDRTSRLPRWLIGHARGAFASARAPVPWPHMVVCGLAAAVPIMVGLTRGELRLAVYGGLAGYLLALNDHYGALYHRVLVSALSFAALAGSFVLGVRLQTSPDLFLAVMGAMTYWLGLMGGTGAEAERLLLFSLIDLVVIQHAPTMTPVVGQNIWPYGLMALGTIFAGQIGSDRWARRYRTTNFARLSSSVRGSITGQLERHRYAVNYTLATIIAVGLTERYQIERGYWMIITVLLVMRPDFRDGLYRQAQRVVGTLGGVLIGDLLILSTNVKALLVAGVFGAAFGVPFALKRNYWLVSFFATIMVVLLLTLPTNGRGDVHLPFVRLLATVYGCAISGAVTLASAGLSALLDRRRGKGARD